MKRTTHGFTLLELVIAIGLFSILVAIATAGYLNALRTDRQVSALIAAQSNAGLALEQIAREARTGYFFDHDISGNPVASDNCTILSSGAVGAPGTQWNCAVLDFYNAQVENVRYWNASGTLMRQASAENGGAPEPITADNVNIKSLQFIVQGQLEGDHWNPRITILMQAAPSSTDPNLANDTLNLETSISSREIDCGAATGC